MPNFSTECGRNRIPSSRKTAPRSQASSRSGEILDMLVFLIAAVLIPAWLLGHLYLTFYPAPATADNASASGSLFGDESTDGSANESEKDGTDGAEIGSSDNGEGNDAAGLDTPDLKLGALTEKSNLLQSEVDSLTNNNSQLKAEIERLNSAASNAPAPGQADSAAMSELQNKLDNQTLELTSARQGLANAEQQSQKHQQEKQELQNSVSNLQLKLEQTQADLASSKEAMNNQADNEITVDSPFAEAPMEDSNADANAAMLEEQKAKVSELSAKVEELSLNLSNTNSTLSQRDEELRKAQAALANIQARNGELKTALAAMEDAKRMEDADAASPTPIASTPRENSLKLMPREVYRDFVSSKGSTSKMAFVRWEGDDIIVRSFSNKRLYRLTLDRFSAPDQQYLLEKKQ